jgi:hydrogenase expression/formation protein HypC
MCLALPARITQLHDAASATVELGGIRQRNNISLLDDLAVDDFVVVHVGYALSRLDPEEARRTLALLAAGSREAAGS